MLLSAAKFVTSLAAESIPKEVEMTMKESAEHYRLVRQRTVGSETTKDKAGALPPAVYEKAKTGTWSELSFLDNNNNNYITIYNYNKNFPRILCSWKIVNPK